MHSERFQFALERLQNGDWEIFETFASQYHVFDYGEIRSVGSPSGDLGRDAELFSPDGQPSIFFQYSVTQSWKTKIKKTAARIKKNFKDASLLVYVTNQEIGALGDETKKELLKDFKLLLDIHDRSWFLDRLPLSSERQALAEDLAVRIVDPYLASRALSDSKGVVLTQVEAESALVHLQLQWEDDTREKGLTKLSYEALVKSALRSTDSDHRITTKQLKEIIYKLLPSHKTSELDLYIENAIKRLDKKAVRLFPKDEICLSHEEVLRVRESVAHRERIYAAYVSEVDNAVKDELAGQSTNEEVVTKLSTRVRRLLDKVLVTRGERFVNEVITKKISLLEEDIQALVTQDFNAVKDDTGLGALAFQVTRAAVVDILAGTNINAQEFLRGQANAYMLFYFLRATPDVQTTIKKIFGDGFIWLDTTVILPILAETLVPEDERRISNLLKAAHAAGIQLRVTPGVVEEVERHINKCIAYVYVPRDKWKGDVPFLFSIYAISGRNPSAFKSWSENFCGSERPQEDVSEYLEDEWSIRTESLKTQADEMPEAIRHALQRIWHGIHETRRSGEQDHDELTIDRLASHDYENYLGVIRKRVTSGEEDLGFRYWWLTIDKYVWSVHDELRKELGNDTPKSPVMSPDFLANYLAIGPMRSRIPKDLEQTIPVALVNIVPEHVPQELVEIAQTVHTECEGKPNRLIRRRLRDTIDRVKMRPGEISQLGMSGLREQLIKSIKAGD